MAARAIWKGELKVGTAKVPVKLYSAVVDRTVHFHILDKHKMRVKQFSLRSYPRSPQVPGRTKTDRRN